jgi:ankyrin repeat protein
MFLSLVFSPASLFAQIDVESMGLDKIEDEKNIIEEVKIDSKTDIIKSKLINQNDQNKSQTSKEIEKNKVENEKNELSESEIKPNNRSNTKKTAQEKINKNSVKKSFINNQKKANLKKQKIAKQKREEIEKKRKEDLKKLNELREKYLSKTQENKPEIDENQYDEDFLQSDNILPRKKNLSKFIKYEVPPPPIANNYRTYENIHIPLIINPAEYIAMIFESITINDIKMFEEVFKKVENPNIKNEIGDTILTYAILLQRYEFIASIIARGSDPNMANNLGFTPMRIAIEIKDNKIFELLLKAEADVFLEDINGQNYLMHAARVGFLFAIDNLIKKGVEVNKLDRLGFSALGIANQNQQNLAAALLVKNGADKVYEKPYDPYSDSIIKQLENKWNQ